MSLIPERLVNFRCYSAAEEMLGQTDVELPSFDAMTETISGAGIAGEYASPVPGHFASQQVKLKWRVVTRRGLLLLATSRAVFDIRGSVQMQDSAGGPIVTQPLRVECTGQLKTKNLGKLEPGKVMGVESDIELSVIRISLNNERLIELDKFNMIYKVGGIDQLAKIRQDLGA